MANADIERIKASKGEIWDGGSTNVQYSWGQLNSDYKKDYELSIEQSLGSFLTPVYKNALVKSQIATGRSYMEMVKKEITAEVTRAWAYYQYARSAYDLYNEQEEIANKLKASAELRYEQGDIDKVQKDMISTMAANIHASALQWREEVALAEKDLHGCAILTLRLCLSMKQDAPPVCSGASTSLTLSRPSRLLPT